MSKTLLNEMLTGISTMGSNELTIFGKKVHESLLDSQEKHQLLDAIEKREGSLDKSDVMVEFSEVTLD